jgi:hypothetical protein
MSKQPDIRSDNQGTYFLYQVPYHPAEYSGLFMAGTGILPNTVPDLASQLSDIRLLDVYLDKPFGASRTGTGTSCKNPVSYRFYLLNVYVNVI